MNLPIAMFTASHEHSWHSPGDHEVEQPLRRGCVRDVHGAETGSGNFGSIDPARWAPTELEEPAPNNQHQYHKLKLTAANIRKKDLRCKNEDANQCDITLGWNWLP